MASNVEILTHSHAVVKAKARAKKKQIDQIVFDEDARREFLTGFRKRNLLKKEAAKAKAKERERQERLDARREQRKARQEQAILNAKLVEDAYRKGANKSNDDDEPDEEEFTGFSAAEKGKAKAVQEYEDGEQLATVTVVEEFNPESLRHMPPSQHSLSKPSDSNEDKPTIHPSTPEKLRQSQRPTNGRHGSPPIKVESTTSSRKIKIKPKKFAYETKAARKVSRLKQRARRAQKAELAGGNTSQNKGGTGKRVRRRGRN